MPYLRALRKPDVGVLELSETNTEVNLATSRYRRAVEEMRGLRRVRWRSNSTED